MRRTRIYTCGPHHSYLVQHFPANLAATCASLAGTPANLAATCAALAGTPANLAATCAAFAGTPESLLPIKPS